MTGNNTCCVVDCKNEKKNIGIVHYYRFPTASHKLQQRRKWISAVNRANPDSSGWQPKPHTRICSKHFVGNSKSDNQFSPSYVPTIFPSAYKRKPINQESLINRHDRFMRRRLHKLEPVAPETVDEPIEVLQLEYQQSMKIDQGCQSSIFCKKYEVSKTFICNRYCNNYVCDAEIQTDINNDKIITVSSMKKYADKCCGESKIFVDQSAGPDESTASQSLNHRPGFLGYESIRTEEQLLDLAGVSNQTFTLLLKLMPSKSDFKRKIAKEDKLLIFLCKMKTGLSYSALSVLYSVHRSTISQIFLSVLQHLAVACRNFVVWPSKEVVRGTMPECFKKEYKDCRAIIDCTEIYIEKPSTVEKCVQMYSTYKKGFTVKVLIACTPGGLISFNSKGFSGRTSDSQITVRSGFLDLLEPGDTVLADKGFPGVQSAIDNTGKKILLVMPPFLHNPVFTREDVEDTYKVASVRIHIERIMQRIKIYHILNKLPICLLPYCDEIIFMCCALVNLHLRS